MVEDKQFLLKDHLHLASHISLENRHKREGKANNFCEIFISAQREDADNAGCLSSPVPGKWSMYVFKTKRHYMSSLQYLKWKGCAMLGVIYYVCTICKLTTSCLIDNNGGCNLLE